MPEPDLTEEAPPLVQQALDAVDGMDAEDWVASALAFEVERQRALLADLEQRDANYRRKLEEYHALAQRTHTRDKTRLAELLKAVGADPLRDWDDLLNAVKGIERARRYQRLQMDRTRELANAATPVLLSDPADCTHRCYEGPVCDCSGKRISRAWDLDPAAVIEALSETLGDATSPWDALLHTVVELRVQNSNLRTQLERRADDDILPDAMAEEMLRRKGFRVDEEGNWKKD
jgi:hypothetical protein